MVAMTSLLDTVLQAATRVRAGEAELPEVQIKRDQPGDEAAQRDAHALCHVRRG